ncbi:uncharacterized protein LOC130733753 isoform X2 [Lotus japonicus]|uniref:uncharacterized protein LOC130733753 isoform X2 n=1 Tax=Lotus japonicus TaxID=34305 RepID=UPI002586407B|nr:uncharacterized protein LOC130733753 isoform X2 [Lotus japonicus]
MDQSELEHDLGGLDVMWKLVKEEETIQGSGGADALLCPSFTWTTSLSVILATVTLGTFLLRCLYFLQIHDETIVHDGKEMDIVEEEFKQGCGLLI